MNRGGSHHDRDGAPTPEEIRGMVRRVRAEAQAAESAPATTPEARGADLIDAYFDQEMDEKSLIAFERRLRADPDLRREWRETRDAVRAVASVGGTPDLAGSILAELDARSHVAGRVPAQRPRWALWTSLAAGVALAAGAGVWSLSGRGAYGPSPDGPALASSPAPTPVGTGAPGPAEGVPPVRGSDPVPGPALAASPARPTLAPPKLTFGESSDRTNWTTDLTAPRPSGGDAALASIGVTSVRPTQPTGAYIPMTMSEARTLRAMWEPQLVMGETDPDHVSAVQRSWWLRAATRAGR